MFSFQDPGFHGWWQKLKNIETRASSTRGVEAEGLCVALKPYAPFSQ